MEHVYLSLCIKQDLFTQFEKSIKINSLIFKFNVFLNLLTLIIFYFIVILNLKIILYVQNVAKLFENKCVWIRANAVAFRCYNELSII